MKIQVDSFLKAENLNGATKEKPLQAAILDVRLIPVAELGFPSEEDRYELRLQLGDGVDYTWLINKTSLRALVTTFGNESDTWGGKKINLYSLSQNVAGEIKSVVYCTPVV